jgi:hypothetical protein
MNIELTIELSDKQKSIFNDCVESIYDYIVTSCGRQVGKTSVAQITSFQWAVSRANVNVGFFLPTYKQCKNVFKRMKKMLQDMLKESLVSFVAQPEFCITFYNGSTIQFFTADNDNFRGYTFDYLICDEACFIRDEIWGVLQPTIAVALSRKENKGKILLLSTPKTKNWFYGFVNSESKNVKVYKFTSQEGGIISKEVIEDIKSRTPDAIFKNEYLGEFLDAGNGLFRYLPCIKEVVNTQGVVAGLDLGTKDDYTVLTIMNRQGQLIALKRYKDLDYDVILKSVIVELKRYGKPLVHIETNGVGQMPYEFMKKSYGKVKPWVTTVKSKNDIIQKLILDFNTEEITILDNGDLKDELDNFTVEWVKGNPKYGGSNGFHDDCVMSLAICNFNRPAKVQSKATNIKKVKRKLM